jgi:hypothetical protein
MEDLKCREEKTGFFRKRLMQTGSSDTFIGWKSGKTTYISLWDRMEGGVAMDSGLSCSHTFRIYLFFNDWQFDGELYQKY